MGVAKRDMMEHQQALENATNIAIDAGVLVVCEHCDTTVYQVGDDVDQAIEYADERYEDMQYEGMFESREQMHALIKEAIESNPGEDCFHCAEKLCGDD